MPRAIVRCSLNADQGSVQRNDLVAILTAAGFERIGTFSYAADNSDTAQLLATVSRLLSRLRQMPGHVRLDHLWIYIDKHDPEFDD